MEKEPFISLVLPESVLGDNRLTYFERILLWKKNVVVIRQKNAMPRNIKIFVTDSAE